MAEIIAGLTTEMTYVVVASHVDFGGPSIQHGNDREFWGMRKPPYEAYKIVEVMRSWGTTVFAVGDVASVNGQPCYASLRDLPQSVDCAIISLPPADALGLVDEVVSFGIKTVWLQYGAGKQNVRQAYLDRGIHAVVSCVLLHWDVDHVHGMNKGRHVCYMHGNLERVARIRVDADGIPQRIEPTQPEQMPFSRETYGTRLLAPFWPKPANSYE
jgi:uncharacterized protein